MGVSRNGPLDHSVGFNKLSFGAIINYPGESKANHCEAFCDVIPLTEIHNIPASIAAAITWQSV